jgi:hypothetical protein
MNDFSAKAKTATIWGNDPVLRCLVLLALAMATSLAAAASMGTAHAASGPRWIIEQRSLVRLPAGQQALITAGQGSIIMADSKAAFGQHGTNAEHYTTIGRCSDLTITVHYFAKCLSLKAAPPPAGTRALYDPEPWQLTDPSEIEHECKAMFQAAAMIEVAGATMIAAPSTTGNKSLMQCAARAAHKTNGEVMVHMQIQPLEMDPDAYMHRLRQSTRWARDPDHGVPGITVSFGVSTNPKYGATAAGMHTTWQQATGYLGPAAPCWLNIIPDTTTQAAKASKFLTLVYR